MSTENKPAAAQEAAAWQRRYIGATRGGIPSQWHSLTKEEFEQCRAGKWSDSYEFRELYAAPVDAAPVDGRDVRSAIAGLEGSVAVGSDGEWVSVRRAARDAAVMALRNVSLDCAHIYAAYSEAKASTPAAPGIDLEQFRPAVCAMGLYAEEPGDVDEAKRLLALIDASPKSATFPNDGNSEAQLIADGERLNCPSCGGSGHVEDSPVTAAPGIDLSEHHVAVLRDMREHMANRTMSLNDWDKLGTAAIDAVLALIDASPKGGSEATLAYWRVTFRMYRDDPELCVLFVGGQEKPTLDSIGVTPRPIELVNVEPRFVEQNRLAEPSIEATPSIAVDPSIEVTPLTDAARSPVTDAMVELACNAFTAAGRRERALPSLSPRWMRAALEAAMQATSAEVGVSDD